MPPQESANRTNGTTAEEDTERFGAKPSTYVPYSGEIVYSGFSGRYPESDNVDELKENLFNKLNMVVVDNRRWELGYWGLPDTYGKIKNISLFDADFFGYGAKAAEVIDPQQRIMLEVVYEALCDAGEDISAVRGTRTGVYMGVMITDAEHAWFGGPNDYCLSGCVQAALANRVSHFFDFHGPSCTYDTACSSSIYALEAAETHLRSGAIDMAIVGAANFVLKPGLTATYFHMNMLSTDYCRAFDSAGDGFTRADGCIAIVLRRATDAKRIYATDLGTMTNNDGFHTNGLLYPNMSAQEQLMRDVYNHFKIDVNDIEFFECHGTGTPAGDPVETTAIDRVYWPKRKAPLKVGSIKSNVGHTEVASGLAGMSKLFITINEKRIPPNLHFNNPNPNVPGLFNGRLKVIDEATEFNGGLMVLNSFGMSGSNAHTVLRPYMEKKTGVHPASTKPRLFVYGCRTEQGVNEILDSAQKYADNVDYHALAQETANMKNMPYRGAVVLNSEQEYREIQKIGSKVKQVWFVFPGMGCQWIGMARQMMEMDVFRESITETAGYLKEVNIDLLDILMNGDESSLKPHPVPFVCICSIQIALTDVLRAVGIVPDGILGHSLGEVGAGYADGALTKREAILAAYYRGHVVVNRTPPKGKMAAVGMTWEEVKEQAPKGVVAACHNGETSVTISGEEGPMDEFMAELAARDVFVKGVNSNNIAYHSHHMQALAADLKGHLEKIITPKPRSARWVSSSIPEERWEEPLAQTASADYQANNLKSPVLFHEAVQKIPKGSIVIEVAPMGLLQSVLKKTVEPEGITISLQKRNSDKNLDFFFSAIGKAYCYGAYVRPLGIYPPVQFPVPHGTPGLSSIISRQWDHDVEWPIPRWYEFERNVGGQSGCDFKLDTGDNAEDEYLVDHALDGKALFPGMGSVVLAWKALASTKNMDFDTMPVQLTNVQIHQAMFIKKEGTYTVTVSVSPSDGAFQVKDGDTVMASGFVKAQDGAFLETDQHTKSGSSLANKPATEVITKEEVYREFIIRGYEYGPYFQGIQRASVDGTDADIRFDGRWISFLDSALQMIVLARRGDQQMLPIKFDVINIDPTLNPAAPSASQEAEVVPAHYDSLLDVISVGGIEIKGITTITANRRLTHAPSCQEDYMFVPFNNVKEGERTSTGCTQAVRNYADALVELCRQGMNQMVEQGHWELENKDRIIECIENTTKHVGKSATADYAAAKAALEAVTGKKNGIKLPGAMYDNLFTALFELPLTKERPEVARNLHQLRFDYFDDVIVDSLESGDILKTVFDTVADNINKNVMDICEVGARRSALFRKAIPHALNYTHIHDYKYTVLDAIYVDDAEDYPCKQLKFDTMDPNNYPDSVNDAYDVLVLKQHLHNQADLDEAMLAFDRMLRPGGFIYLVETVQRHAVLYPIESYVFPEIGGRGGLEGDRIYGCYYTEEQWRALFKRHGYEEIFHRSDGVINSGFLFRKRMEGSTAPTIVNVDDYQASWIGELQTKLTELQNSSDEDARLWLVSKADYSGLIGLFAALRWEAGSERIRCVQVSNHTAGSSVPNLKPGSPEFEALQKKDLTFNIYRDGRWGTYTNLTVTKEMQRAGRLREHVFADTYTSGDLTSLGWFDSPLSLTKQTGKATEGAETCAVYYAGLNLRDLLLANGARKKEDLPTGMNIQDGVLGVEFSGRDASGRRVMGLCAPPALASTVRCPKSALWSVPDNWILKEAATVPLAYSAAFYALMSKARLRRGQKVFVQAGWTSIGQAAIAIALSYGCDVYTLVRNNTEAVAVRAVFPTLNEKHICSTSDKTFVKNIKRMTGGKGVDVVLNFEGADLISGTLDTVARRGCFVDISVIPDQAVTTQALTTGAKRNFNVQRLDLESVITEQGSEWTEIRDLVQQGINNGTVKPLRKRVFAMSALVDAFKTVDSVHKVVLKVRDEERQKITPTPKTTFPSSCRTSFDSDKSYVLVGGLGGLGVEVVDWMITRGARKFVLTSRSGVKTGYQVRKLAYLREQGAQVEAVALTLNSEKNAKEMVKIATKLGPIGGLFNMGMVLNDDQFMSQTQKTFNVPLEVKVTATLLMDKISREAAVKSSLDHFVMFSSVTGSDGNVGQSNYSFGNSFMERLCERRRLEGLPAFAVEMGPVADTGAVGLFGNDGIYCAKAQQRLWDVKLTLDYCLSQDHVIVKSYVIPEKTALLQAGDDPISQQVAKGVAKILGVKDLSSVDGDKEFFELGMDSLMSVEIKQLLERDVAVVTSVKELQLMTFNALKDLVDASQ